MPKYGLHAENALLKINAFFWLTTWMARYFADSSRLSFLSFMITGGKIGALVNGQT